jgi:hypothetical protein
MDIMKTSTFDKVGWREMMTIRLYLQPRVKNVWTLSYFIALIYLGIFILNLFNDTLNCPDYIASNDKLISE